MPRVAIPVSTIVRTGLTPPAEQNGDTVNQHQVDNNGRTIILARNSGAGARTITFRVAKIVDGLTAPTRVVSIPAAASRYFGPFPVDDWGILMQIDVEHAEVKLTALTMPG